MSLEIHLTSKTVGKTDLQPKSRQCFDSKGSLHYSNPLWPQDDSIETLLIRTDKIPPCFGIALGRGSAEQTSPVPLLQISAILNFIELVADRAPGESDHP